MWLGILSLVTAALASALGVSPNSAVAANLGLRLVDELPGRILDVTADQILFVDETVAPEVLRLKDRASATVETVSNSGPFPFGYLSPAGAIFTTQPGDVTTTRLFDWRPPGSSR